MIWARIVWQHAEGTHAIAVTPSHAHMFAEELLAHLFTVQPLALPQLLRERLVLHVVQEELRARNERIPLMLQTGMAVGNLDACRPTMSCTHVCFVYFMLVLLHASGDAGTTDPAAISA